jgi:hypothetical protein
MVVLGFPPFLSSLDFLLSFFHVLLFHVFVVGQTLFFELLENLFVLVLCVVVLVGLLVVVVVVFEGILCVSFPLFRKVPFVVYLQVLGDIGDFFLLVLFFVVLGILGIVLLQILQVPFLVFRLALQVPFLGVLLFLVVLQVLVFGALLVLVLDIFRNLSVVAFQRVFFGFL